MALRSNVLAQLEAWVLARERNAQPSGPCNILVGRSLSGLRQRVQMLVDPVTPSDEELRLLRRRAMTHRLLPGPVVFDSPRSGPRNSYKRPPPPKRGSREPVDNIISISRFSGRQRKMPGKFKEPISPPWKHTSHRKPASEGRAHQRAEPRRRPLGISRQNSRSILTGSKASRSAPRAAGGPTEEEAPDEDLACVRVGDDYQAEVSDGPPPRDSQERADVLVWSASGCALPAAELDAYISSALPLVGGPLQNPPNQAPPQDSAPPLPPPLPGPSTAQPPPRALVQPTRHPAVQPAQRAVPRRARRAPRRASPRSSRTSGSRRPAATPPPRSPRSG